MTCKAEGGDICILSGAIFGEGISESFVALLCFSPRLRKHDQTVNFSPEDFIRFDVKT